MTIDPNVPAHRRAAVIGASMAGLLAARALSDHYDEVVLFERDKLPDSAEPRKGAPQTLHLHVLLARGQNILAELFPGIIDELVQGGAEIHDAGLHFRWHQWGSWKVTGETGIMGLYASRLFIEANVRRRTLALPNVKRLDQHDVEGLKATPDRSRVSGVIFRSRDGEGPPQTLDAGLVVDASGRGSATPRWLEALGSPRPEESIVKISVKYATRVFRAPNPSPHAWKTLYVLGKPPESKRLGVIVPIEGGRWIATLAGVLDDHPPSDEEGFFEFAKGLPVLDVYAALRAAEPLTDVVTYKFPSNQRRHYDRMDHLPDGLAVVGDALCSFNPIYGQGMTTAALGALTLGQRVAEERRSGSLPGSSRRIQQALAKATDAPWAMTTGEDFRYPEVLGKRPPGSAVLGRYLGRVFEVASHDIKVLTAFYRAMNMIDPPEALLHPKIMLRVLKG